MAKAVRLIVCINERLGAGQRSCVGSGNLEFIRKIEGMISSEGLEVPVIKRACLNRCEEGPVMRIAPAGPFFTEIDDASLASIVAELKKMVLAHDG